MLGRSCLVLLALGVLSAQCRGERRHVGADTDLGVDERGHAGGDSRLGEGGAVEARVADLPHEAKLTCDSISGDSAIELYESDGSDVGECRANCEGVACGEDGCLGSCGECEDERVCVGGTCAVAACLTADCGEFESCHPDLGVCVARMVEIPPGSFWMGCNPATETACQPEALPFHKVITPAYEISLTEVTVRQYSACVDAGVCLKSNWNEEELFNGKEHIEPTYPQGFVNALDAADYCHWIGGQLCSEAQWEKAARGGCEVYGDDDACSMATPPYPWGWELPNCHLAVINDAALGKGCGVGIAASVGTKASGASPYGVLDMSGNKSEWTSDCFYGDYTNAPTDGSAWMEEGCLSADLDFVAIEGIVRGGGAGTPSGGKWLKSYYRDIALFIACESGIRCCRWLGE